MSVPNRILPIAIALSLLYLVFALLLSNFNGPIPVSRIGTWGEWSGLVGALIALLAITKQLQLGQQQLQLGQQLEMRDRVLRELLPLRADYLDEYSRIKLDPEYRRLLGEMTEWLTKTPAPNPSDPEFQMIGSNIVGMSWPAIEAGRRLSDFAHALATVSIATDIAGSAAHEYASLIDQARSRLSAGRLNDQEFLTTEKVKWRALVSALSIADHAPSS